MSYYSTFALPKSILYIAKQVTSYVFPTQIPYWFSMPLRIKSKPLPHPTRLMRRLLTIFQLHLLPLSPHSPQHNYTVLLALPHISRTCPSEPLYSPLGLVIFPPNNHTPSFSFHFTGFRSHSQVSPLHHV